MQQAPNFDSHIDAAAAAATYFEVPSNKALRKIKQALREPEGAEKHKKRKKRRVTQASSKVRELPTVHHIEARGNVDVTFDPFGSLSPPDSLANRRFDEIVKSVATEERFPNASVEQMATRISESCMKEFQGGRFLQQQQRQWNLMSEKAKFRTISKLLTTNSREKRRCSISGTAKAQETATDSALSPRIETLQTNVDDCSNEQQLNAATIELRLLLNQKLQYYQELVELNRVLLSLRGKVGFANVGRQA